MAKPTAGAVPSDKLELYEKLVAINPSVQQGRNRAFHFAERSYV